MRKKNTFLKTNIVESSWQNQIKLLFFIYTKCFTVQNAHHHFHPNRYIYKNLIILILPLPLSIHHTFLGMRLKEVRKHLQRSHQERPPMHWHWAFQRKCGIAGPTAQHSNSQHTAPEGNIGRNFKYPYSVIHPDSQLYLLLYSVLNNLNWTRFLFGKCPEKKREWFTLWLYYRKGSCQRDFKAHRDQRTISRIKIN